MKKTSLFFFSKRIPLIHPLSLILPTCDNNKVSRKPIPFHCLIWSHSLPICTRTLSTSYPLSLSQSVSLCHSSLLHSHRYRHHSFSSTKSTSDNLMSSGLVDYLLRPFLSVRTTGNETRLRCGIPTTTLHSEHKPFANGIANGSWESRDDAAMV